MQQPVEVLSHLEVVSHPPDGLGRLPQTPIAEGGADQHEQGIGNQEEEQGQEGQEAWLQGQADSHRSRSQRRPSGRAAYLNPVTWFHTFTNS